MLQSDLPLELEVVVGSRLLGEVVPKDVYELLGFGINLPRGRVELD
jgi:hypothetical protein